MNPRRESVDVGNAVINDKDLSAAVDFSCYGVGDKRFAVLHDVSLHGHALCGRSIEYAYVAYAHKRHMQRARYGRSRKRKHVYAALKVLDFFLVRHAETLFFIQNKQSKVRKVHVLGQKPVSPHYYIGFTRAHCFLRF